MSSKHFIQNYKKKVPTNYKMYVNKKKKPFSDVKDNLNIKYLNS
jgi:hypothetical protein